MTFKSFVNEHNNTLLEMAARGLLTEQEIELCLLAGLVFLESQGLKYERTVKNSELVSKKSWEK
jgi:hypothetical protein